MAVPNPPIAMRLSSRDREVLWLLSQGMTYFQIGRRLGLTEKGAQSNARRIMSKLHAANVVHAVSLALLKGEIGRWPDCGTHRAYQRHRRAGHTADPACLLAKAQYDRNKRGKGAAGIPTFIRPPEGPEPGVRVDQEYIWPGRGKHVRVKAIEPDGEHAEVEDVATGRVTRVKFQFFHASPMTKYGTERRHDYVLIKETRSK